MSQSPPNDSASPALPDGLPLPRRHVAVLALLSGLALVVIDGAIANVALPALAQQLHGTVAHAVWVVTGYQLAVVMCLLPATALGERFGHRRVFTAGLAAFVAGSAWCAAASSLDALIAGRLLQGIGGAAVMPLSLALLRHTYPSRLLGTALSRNALTIALCAAIGPLLASSLLALGSWRWLFAVNLPIGAVALLACRGLPDPAGAPRRIDAVSVALNAVVFAGFVLGADRLSTDAIVGAGWLLAAGVALATLVRRERRQATPLVPLDLLRSRSLRMSVVASVCCFSAQTAGLIALPFHFQHGLGLDLLHTGLLMTPWPLGVAIAAPLAGRWSDRWPTAWLCAAGALALALGLGASAVLPLHATLAWSVMATTLAGLGFGFFQTPNNRNLMLSAPRHRSGAAAAMQATARLTGQTVGSLAVGMLFTLIAQGRAPRAALGLAAVLAVGGAWASWRRHRPSAGALDQPRSEPSAAA